jgi:hypothetical protein
MNGILGNFLVGLLLAVSVVYAVVSLGPRTLRPRLLASMSRVTARAPAFLGLRRASQWLANASAAKAAGACGGCDSCASDQTPSQTSPAPDVTIPVSKIGRRA